MENFIFVIIGVLFFAYQTYANYKKEQEAAKNRRPSTPRKSEPTQKQVERPSQQSPEPAPLEIPRWLENILQPQTETSPKQEQLRRYGEYESEYEAYVPTEAPADLQAEYRNRSDTKEIERVKKLKALPDTNQYKIKTLKPHTFEKAEVNSNDIPSFDLRDAIIMNAILTRPDY